jgi:uncharacterized protein YyaL (SSP411 family)
MSEKLKSNYKITNRLINEASPYLLQHSFNPVDWYPWGEEAFNKARKEKKPILLSIGYSACHWCHVMAHESFENDTIAKYMNENFVNIKVDREEYPDVDHLYQSFVQMSAGRGGWPLTVFLTPDRIPFYGGTYFPIESRYGMISFPDLMKRIVDIYQDEPEQISQSIMQIKQAFQKINAVNVSGDNYLQPTMIFENLFENIKKSFDPEYGGFRPAPKFPHVLEMDFLLNLYFYTGKEEAKQMVLFTLKKMAQGGIFDQIGGGFHRYSTDEYWLVPHFEKMLYDNALLISLYTDAFRITGDVYYKRIAEKTADFVLRRLTDSSGSFYSSLDADSEGEEGKYYTWKYDEVMQIIGNNDANLFCEYFNITQKGNFEGGNVLNIKNPIKSLSKKYGISQKELEKNLGITAEKLFQARKKRIRPGLDNKILADWNGMMISALWDIYKIKGNQYYFNSAERALDNIVENYIQSNGSVSHFIKNEQKNIFGYIDDYAFVVQAFIEGFETTQREEYLSHAVSLCEYTLKYFWDSEKGGFFFTDKKRGTFITRLRNSYDTSTPAGNSKMCLNLLKLHSYTGKKQYFTKAEKIFRLYINDIENKGVGFTSLIRALMYHYYTPVEIIISIGDYTNKINILECINQFYVPNKISVTNHLGQEKSLINPDLLQNRSIKDRNVYYICYQKTCSLPLDHPSQITDTLHDFKLNIH